MLILRKFIVSLMIYCDSVKWNLTCSIEFVRCNIFQQDKMLSVSGLHRFAERRLRVFENRILRRIYGPKRDDNGDWRRLHNVPFT